MIWALLFSHHRYIFIVNNSQQTNCKRAVHCTMSTLFLCKRHRRPYNVMRPLSWMVHTERYFGNASVSDWDSRMQWSRLFALAYFGYTLCVYYRLAEDFEMGDRLKNLHFFHRLSLSHWVFLAYYSRCIFVFWLVEDFDTSCFRFYFVERTKRRVYF